MTPELLIAIAVLIWGGALGALESQAKGRSGVPPGFRILPRMRRGGPRKPQGGFYGLG